MSNIPRVDASIAIHQDCAITYLITSRASEAEFSFGGPPGSVHCVFDAQALGRFLLLGTKVLQEMEEKAGSDDYSEGAFANGFGSASSSDLV